MLGSYGLLGIFVYCEHKAGSPLPPHVYFGSLCFSLWIMWKSMVTYIQTRRPGEPGGWRGGGVLAGVTVVPLTRGSPLCLGASINIVPNTSNKTGMKSLPRSLRCFWLKHYFFVMFLGFFVHGFDKYQCCFCIFFLKGLSFIFMQAESPLYLFYPTHIFVKQKFSYFCNFFLFLW